MPKLTSNPKRRIPSDPDDTIQNEFGIVYLFRTPRGVSMMGFSGGRKNYDFYYIYPNEKQAHDKATHYLANLEGAEAFRTERRAYRNGYTTKLQVGSILYSSWGYDQTNVNWYQVIEVKSSGKSVIVREIARDITEDGFMSGRSIPKVSQFVGEPMLKRVTQGDRLTINESQSAFPWDGKPKHCSWYA